MKPTTDKKRWMDSTKMLWHMDRVIAHFDKGERISPIHLDCGLTKKCNERCVYCYGYFQNMSGEVMSRDALVNNLVGGAVRAGVRSLGFIGDGESTLNPAMYEALKVGKEGGLSLAVSTNGILLDTDEKRETVLENCEWMRFNISALSKEGFRKIHSSNKRDTVLANIKRTVDLKRSKGYKCDIGLQMVFVPQLMYDEVVPLSQYARDVGVDYFVIKQCSLPEENKKCAGLEFSVDDYDDKDVVKILKEAQALSTPQTQIVPKWNLIEQKGVKPYEGCPSVPLIWEVSGDGGCYPCGYFFGGKNPEKCFGNLNEQPLDDILRSDRYWDIIKTMRTFDVHKDCAGCCRLDKPNEFIYEYLNKPKGVNFV